jgi:flavin reductase (DIM6/NTAB) family NADH-FMN oxidoreductase RutF
MSNQFSSLSLEKVRENPFRLIGDEWMLVTAGTPQSWNTMTAAWGGLGFLWQRDVAFAFIRPNRYTYQFMQQVDYFTLSFFGQGYRRELNYCGKHSGRDVDKAQETGLTPVSLEHNTVSFEQARLILICRKIYSDAIKPELFLEQSIDNLYPERQYHRMYIGEVLDCLTKDGA